MPEGIGYPPLPPPIDPELAGLPEEELSFADGGPPPASWGFGAPAVAPETPPPPPGEENPAVEPLNAPEPATDPLALPAEDKPPLPPLGADAEPELPFARKTGAFSSSRDANLLPIGADATLALTYGSELDVADAAPEAPGLISGELEAPQVERPELTPTVEEEAAFLLRQGPEYMALQRLRLEEEQRQDQLRQQQEEQKARQEAIEASRRQQEENQRILQRANERAAKISADLDAEAKRIAQAEIDPDRWMKTRDTGQKIAAFISAIAGGILSPYRGGRNDGLEMIMGQINQDIEAQKAGLANQQQALGQRRGLVAELRAQGMSDYQAAETARRAMLENVEAELEARRSQVDPRGTQALWLAEGAQQARAAKAEHLAKIEEATRKRLIEDEELQLKRDKQTLDELSKGYGRDADGNLVRIHRGGGGRKMPPEYYSALYGPEGAPPIPMTQKEHQAWLGTRGKVADLSGGGAKDELELRKLEAEVTKAESEAGATATGLELADGSDLFAPTVDEAKELRSSRADLDTAARILDEMNAVRAATKGTTWRQVNTGQKRRLKALHQQMTNMLGRLNKAGAMGVDEFKRYMKQIGDPNSFWESDATRDTLRRVLVDGFNDKARAAALGKKIKRYEPPKSVFTKTKDEARRDYRVSIIPGVGVQGAQERGRQLDEALDKIGGFKSTPDTNAQLEQFIELGQARREERAQMRRHQAEIEELKQAREDFGELTPQQAQRLEELERVIPEHKNFLIEIDKRGAKFDDWKVEDLD